MRPISRETGFCLDVVDAATIAGRLRNLKTSELEGVSAGLLRRAARQLRAASYSALTAARRFEHRAELLDYERRQEVEA